MSPFVCLFKPVVYGLYAGAQLTEYGGDLFLFVGRNEPFAFAAGEVEAAARKAALYLPSHLAYRFAGHFVIQLRHSAGVPAGCGTAEECAAAFAFQCGYVARVYGEHITNSGVRDAFMGSSATSACRHSLRCGHCSFVAKQ